MRIALAVLLLMVGGWVRGSHPPFAGYDSFDRIFVLAADPAELPK